MMDKDEYWILDSVAVHMIPLSWLEDEDLSLILNRVEHSLSHEPLVGLLSHLSQNRYLIVQRSQQGTLCGAKFMPTRKDIEAGLANEIDLYYGLTEQGGMRWEEASKPDWNRYTTALYGVDPNEAEIVASSRSRVQEILSLQADIGHGSVIGGSEIWDQLVPWQATYWKTLPIGHRVRFNYQADGHTDKDRHQGGENLTKLLEEVWRWYTNPWQDVRQQT